MADIKVGDIVRLKAGGPQMTVSVVFDAVLLGRSQKNIECMWFDAEHKGTFGIETLKVGG